MYNVLSGLSRHMPDYVPKLFGNKLLVFLPVGE